MAKTHPDPAIKAGAQSYVDGLNEISKVAGTLATHKLLHRTGQMAMANSTAQEVEEVMENWKKAVNMTDSKTGLNDRSEAGK